MIKNGHLEAYSYGISFFELSLEQINDDMLESIQNQAIAVRGAKHEDFAKFIDIFEKKTEEDREDSHKANMAMLNKKL